MSSPSAEPTVIEASVTSQPTIPCIDAFDKVLVELDDQIKRLRAVMDTVKSEIKASTTIKQNFLKVRKDVEKNLRKGKKKNNRITDPSRPTGFKKPIPISPELAKFIGVPASEKMSRTDVTKCINKYIKDHNLQNPEARREFDLSTTTQGKALYQLLKPEGNEPVSYFNLQRWLAKHFPKDTSAAPSVPPPAPAPAPPVAASGAPKRRAPASKK
tara:strand:+ start:2817 stop:3458 length:642 start_codon:yes stop_codon:yes gene_type:complete